MSPPPLLEEEIGLIRRLEPALSRALAILGYDRLYDLDDVANGKGGAENADFWLRAVQRKLAGNSGFSEAEAHALLDGYDVSQGPCAALDRVDIAPSRASETFPPLPLPPS